MAIDLTDPNTWPAYVVTATLSIKVPTNNIAELADLAGHLDDTLATMLAEQKALTGHVMAMELQRPHYYPQDFHLFGGDEHYRRKP